MKATQERLGVDIPPQELAALLGLHLSSVYRWLEGKPANARTEALLLILRRQTQSDPNRLTQLREAIQLRGGLRALHMLLSWEFTPGAVAPKEER